MYGDRNCQRYSVGQVAVRGWSLWVVPGIVLRGAVCLWALGNRRIVARLGQRAGTNHEAGAQHQRKTHLLVLLNRKSVHNISKLFGGLKRIRKAGPHRLGGDGGANSGRVGGTARRAATLNDWHDPELVPDLARQFPTEPVAKRGARATETGIGILTSSPVSKQHNDT